MGHKGHWGEYTGNAKWSKDHAHTRVTKGNYKASERDDAAHIDYLKRDVIYDDHHGHSDEKMTADEKHISKLAGDMKYDKEKHGSPTKHKQKRGHDHLSETNIQYHDDSSKARAEYDKKQQSPATNKVEGLSHDELQDKSAKGYERHMKVHGSPGKMKYGSVVQHENKGVLHSHKPFKKSKKKI